MWSRLALFVSLSALASAQSTILGCLTANSPILPILSSADGKSVEDCATACLNRNAWFSAYEPDASACKCSETIPRGMIRGSQGCEGVYAGSIISVIRPQLVTPSSGTSRRESSMPARQAEEALCAEGLRPCSTEALGEYVCMDVSSDMHSCGACKYGEFGQAPWEFTTPPDCTAMPGVIRDSVQCVLGGCVTTACQKGYKLLSDGSCVWIR